MNSPLPKCDPADSEDDAPIRPLTREEAQALRQTVKLISPWRVVVWQCLVGVLLCVLAAAVPDWRDLLGSVAYGAAVVVVSNAVLAWGITRPAAMNANAVVFNFMIWELMKMGVAVAMMAVAAWVVTGLSWPAMLVAIILGMKANWLALLTQRRTPRDA